MTISGQLCHRLHNPEDDTVTIEFTWEKLQCALTYMVSIVNFSDRKLIELETESNSLNISSLKKGSIYQVCVVGVNGFFKGHCLKPLIIDLKGKLLSRCMHSDRSVHVYNFTNNCSTRKCPWSKH